MQTMVLLGDLAALSPGPGLAAALCAVELSAVPNDRMLEVLAAQYRQLCHEQARMAATLAEVGRCEGYPEPGQVSRLPAPERYASEESRAALRWTRRAAESEHDLAETIVHTMPQLHVAWLAGTVDRPRVMVFDRYLTGLAPEQVTAICSAAVPRAPRLTTGQLAVLLRRMVLAVDPDAAARWYRKGIRERNVVAVMGHDGTVTVSGHGLPADEAEAACVRVQDLAAAAKRAGHPGLIGQIRCDLFLGLLGGRFHGMTTEQVTATLIAQYRPDGPGTAVAKPTATSPAAGSPAASAPAAGPPAAAGAPAAAPPATAPPESRPGEVGSGEAVPGQAGGRAGTGEAGTGEAGTGEAGTGEAGTGEAGTGEAQAGIEIRVALSTLLGRDELPGDIPGLGPLPAPDTRARVAQQRRAQWRFAVTDAEGQLFSEGLTRRRPTTVGAHPVGRDGSPGGIVEIHVPVTLLDELAADPAVPGGWAGVIADLAAQHARREEHLADLDARPGDRLPNAALRRHTEIRDRTCTFPGCRRRAHTAEADHTRDHAIGGATTTINTGPLCDHDHDVKHRGGWRLTQPEPGTFVWRSPLGGEYHTRGEFLLPQMPDPHLIDLGPHFDQPTATIDGPILQPYRPVRRPRPPPPSPPSVLPDEPPF